MNTPANPVTLPLAQYAPKHFLLGANLRGRRVPDLLEAPLATDPDARAVIGLLVEILPAAYNSKSRRFPALILEAVNTSLRHGNTAESSLAYAFHGMLCIALFNDVTSAFEYSELSLALVFACCVVLYRFVPPVGPPTRALLIGAAAGAIGFEVATVAYGWYLARFGELSVVYGSLGALLGFLLVVYAGVVAMLVGAELCAGWSATPPE